MWPRAALHILVGRGLGFPARVLQADPLQEVSGSCAEINLRTKPIRTPELTLQVQARKNLHTKYA